MSGAVNALCWCGAAVVLWLLFGLARAVRDVLSERAARWLLPGNQPPTVRLAQLIAALARALAPKRLAGCDIPLLGDLYIPALEWDAADWTAPDSAMAEIEADLLADRRVIDPLRLVAPLLWQALALHFRNFQEIVFWIFLCIVLLIVELRLRVMRSTPGRIVKNLKAAKRHRRSVAK